jgi:phosphoserine phosphatase
MTELIEETRKQAAQRRHIAAQADHCVRWLKAHGFEVLAVTDGPRITVRNSHLCDMLEGAVAGYSRGPKGEERYRCVVRLDCEVRWRCA